MSLDGALAERAVSGGGVAFVYSGKCFLALPTLAMHGLRWVLSAALKTLMVEMAHERAACCTHVPWRS